MELEQVGFECGDTAPVGPIGFGLAAVGVGDGDRGEGLRGHTVCSALSDVHRDPMGNEQCCSDTFESGGVHQLSDCDYRV